MSISTGPATRYRQQRLVNLPFIVRLCACLYCLYIWDSVCNVARLHVAFLIFVCLLCGPPPRRGPHIASHSVCLPVCPSVCLSVRPVSGCTLFTIAPSYDRTSKIEKLRFSLMGQRHVCTFRHAQRAEYRTAISAAQTIVYCSMIEF